MQYLCLACVVACPDSFLDHTFSAFRAGILFTHKAFYWITGALCVTVFIIRNFTRLGRAGRFIIKGQDNAQ